VSNKGYWVDLQSVALDDVEGNTLWLQAFPVGTYKHPLYGKLEMDSAKAQRMAADVKGKVRGQDLDIDYDHKAQDGKAAGWVKDAEGRDDGLWVQVEFTDDAFASIKKKEYRYFSPEFADKWTHPKTGTVHKDVLFGGALTNRPFLKDILPINMSEVSGQEGVAQVDELLKVLREKLGLGEDASEDEVLKGLNEIEIGPEDKETDPDPEDEDPDPENEEVELSEEIAQHPAVKALTEKVGLLEASNRLAEVNAQITLWNAKDDGFAIPPAVVEPLRSLMTLSDNKTTKLIRQVFDALTEKGMVKLTEAGGTTRTPRTVSTGGSATQSFNDQIKTLMAANEGMSFKEAALEVSREDPELFDGHREEVMEGV
jgi:phage I-like protein